ncbi:protein lethal(2)essential for life-like [Temnothorax curvispinosus]|uniref:Protein lethal(2)essential for life-like n=1 Tax=Temnothorax curvispinosus TaxID=300111 RepID=A0A6J1Q519_9HYME|nr:protein lethal(2)essential for life-like [Temnothorax curvispinosus]
MDLVPFIAGTDWEDLMCQSLLNQLFDLDGRQLQRVPVVPVPTESVRQKLIGPQRRDEVDELRDMLKLAIRRCENPSPPVNKDDFQVVLDVQQFKPEEISVKIVDDHLVVEAKHEDRKDRHGWVSRQFVRRYPLPQDIDVDNMTSKLSSDGLLTLVAPKKRPLKDESVRTLRIECTGKPFVQKQEKPKTLEQGQQGEKEKKQE